MATSDLPNSTANWHWKNKNISSWGYEWFRRELSAIQLTGEKEGEKFGVESVSDVDGDVELGQRKSKLITIYDLRVVVQWTGTASDGSEVKGTLTIPEVSHEITLDGLSDYVYEWNLTTSSPEANALFEQVKPRLSTALEAKFAEFPSAIISTHGKDLTVAGSNDPSRAGTPNNASSSSTSGAAPAGAAAASKPAVNQEEKKPANTSKVSVEGNFQAAADDLFGLLTDEKRIPMWTRAAAQSKPEAGAEYSLFGGGVKGKYVSLSPPKEIVQTWVLNSPTWPSGHTATLTTTLDQSYDSTKLTLSLDGVPTGLEDQIRGNLEGYYIHGFKSIGYVYLIPSPAPSSYYSAPRTNKKPSPKITEQRSTYSYVAVVALTALVLVAAFSVPFFSSLPPLIKK